jgi:hypothetical protein
MVWIFLKISYKLQFTRTVGWFGHIEGMPETRMVKATHCWKPISKRPTGRPKTRWEDGFNPFATEFF